MIASVRRIAGGKEGIHQEMPRARGDRAALARGWRRGRLCLRRREETVPLQLCFGAGLARGGLLAHNAMQDGDDGAGDRGDERTCAP